MLNGYTFPRTLYKQRVGRLGQRQEGPSTSPMSAEHVDQLHIERGTSAEKVDVNGEDAYQSSSPYGSQIRTPSGDMLILQVS